MRRVVSSDRNIGARLSATSRPQATAGAPKTGEIVSHTSLRGVAASCVVFYHAYLPFSKELTNGYFVFFDHSYLFVDLFFVLSGFILTHIYRPWFGDSVQVGTYRRFQWKRFVRIYPTYLFWLAAAIGLSILIAWYREGDPNFGAEKIIPTILHLLLLQALLELELQWNVPLWSIAVEFVGYLFLPFLAWAAVRWREWLLLPLILFAAFSMTYVVGDRGDLDAIYGGMSVLRCLSSFGLGTAAALLLPRFDGWHPRSRTVLQVGTLALALIAVGRGFDILAAATFPILVLATARNEGPLFCLLRLAPFHRLGRISYSLYLAHVPALTICNLVFYKITVGQTIAPETAFVSIGVTTFIASIIAAELSFRLVESRSATIVTMLRRPFGSQ